MVEGVSYLYDVQVKKMKDHTFDSQDVHTGSRSQLFWSNQMLNKVTKDGNRDNYQDMTGNMDGMLVNEFPTQQKDE